MKNLIRKVICFYKSIQLSSKSIHGTNLKYSRFSSISLTEGSKKEHIFLGDNVKFYGSISSQSGGKVTIGNYVQIAPSAIIQSLQKIEIGDFCAIAQGVYIVDNNNHPINPKDRITMMKDKSYMTWKYSNSAPIIIYENVWIGQFSRICKGVTIGKNSIVAANSVVTKNIPENSIVAGNPARIVKTNINLLPERI